MKKYAKIITAILLVSLLALSLFACIDPDRDSNGKMTLVVLDGDNTQEYVVNLADIPSGDSSTGLMAILNHLQDQGKLTYTAQESSYGAFITQVNSIVPQGNEYIAIYTSVTNDIDVSAYATSVTYKDVEYTNSGLGASSMTILADCVIIIAKGTY